MLHIAQIPQWAGIGGMLDHELVASFLEVKHGRVSAQLIAEWIVLMHTAQGRFMFPVE